MCKKITSFFATPKTASKYIDKSIIIKDSNNLYTEIDVILNRSPVALHKEQDTYTVYARKSDPTIWSQYKLRLQNYYFN